MAKTKIEKVETIEKSGEKSVKKIAKGHVYYLLKVIAMVKVSLMSKDGVFALVDMKVELNKIADDLQKKQDSAREELKKTVISDRESESGENVKLSDKQEEELDKKFKEYLNKYLSDKIEVKTLKLSKDDFYELIKGNNLTVEEIEIINLIRE